MVQNPELYQIFVVPAQMWGQPVAVVSGLEAAQALHRLLGDGFIYYQRVGTEKDPCRINIINEDVGAYNTKAYRL